MSTTETEEAVTVEPLTLDAVESLAYQLMDDIRDAAAMFGKGELRSAEIRFEGARFLAGDLEDECRRQREAKEASHAE